MGDSNKERGRGIPRSDVERVAEHYGITIEEAEYWLTIHPVDVLLPERGTGIERGTAAVALGAYTNIVDIIAPASASAGELVNIEAKVKNLAAQVIYISTSGRFDTTIFYLYPEYSTVDAGVTSSFSGSFTMPSKDIRVYVWSYYWTGTEWYLDDESYVDIALAEVYQGSLSKKELEYDETREDIPVL